jgi:hypothetical protein|tara:strand:- start:8017 stop:9165 length:1149 start_codon:yes stop_codon:yes gene_type:complete
MAYYFIYPEKDATIYSHPNRVGLNTGRDEILELLEEKSSVGETYFPSRFLIKFKSTEIKDILENKLSGISTWQSNLEIFSAEHKSLHTDHIIEAYAVSDNWDEGTGRFRNNPTSSNGVTWQMRTDTGSAASAIWATSSFATGITGSSHNFTNISGGGSWYTGSNFIAENSFFNEDNLDLNFDVTQIVKYFSASFYQGALYPTGIKNEGFIIKKPKITEDNPSASFGELQYFSTDTHTIYPPKLTFKWDDSIYSHSGTTLSKGDIFLSLYNNKGEFQRKSKQRFRLTTRKRYPDRTFVSSSNYLDTQYLPATSYYSVRDAETDEVIIPFDTSYTKLSADGEGMYFDLFMEGLQPERYYKLMFRSDNNDGIQIFDEDYYFKVVR